MKLIKLLENKLFQNIIAVTVSILIILLVVLLVISLFMGFMASILPEAFAGRDWEIDLINGYGITHINGHEIVLTYDADPSSQSDNRISLPCVFITGFATNDSYIGIRGIPTKDYIATDEEIASGNEVYYITDTLTHEIHGPYSLESDYLAKCDALNIDNLNDWQSPSWELAEESKE